MTQQRNPIEDFEKWIKRLTADQLRATLKSDAGKEAARRLTMAFASSCRAAKDPSDFMACTQASVLTAIATSVAAGLYPGGPNPSVYLVPQRARRGEQPELQWRITHRGLCILASRAGFGIIAVPVGLDDKLEVSFGEVSTHSTDPTSWPDDLEDLIGVIVVVKRLVDGKNIGRFWTPLGLILKRKATSRYGAVWKAWPIEMALKTAIKFHSSRGHIPMDSPELTAAMSADDASEASNLPAATVTEPLVDVEPVRPKELADNLPPEADEPTPEPEKVTVKAEEKAPKLDLKQTGMP